MSRPCPAPSLFSLSVIFSYFEQNVLFLFKLNSQFSSLVLTETNATYAFVSCEEKAIIVLFWFEVFTCAGTTGAVAACRVRTNAKVDWVRAGKE